jgi:hydroxyacylglutathione hydrolase
MGGTLDVQWIHGSSDCVTNTDPPLQVHAFDQGTYILRQNKCLSFEAPFLYLLFGTERALLLDTGADPGPGRHLPLRPVVQGIIAGWLAERRRPAIDLVVAHTHGDGDHVFADGQFAGQDRTTVVPPSLAGVRSFFGLSGWPDQQAVFDLGGRPLTVIPTPGHEPAHIAVYDARTRILISGDILYPGFLYVRDWPVYRRSIARLVRFVADHPVSYVLGAHIEMTSAKGVAYPSGTTYQPEEHVLQLSVRHLTALHATLESLGDVPARRVLDDFIIEPE